MALLRIELEKAASLDRRRLDRETDSLWWFEVQIAISYAEIAVLFRKRESGFESKLIDDGLNWTNVSANRTGHSHSYIRAICLDCEID